MSKLIKNGHVAGFAGVLAVVIAVSCAAYVGEQELKRYDREHQESIARYVK